MGVRIHAGLSNREFNHSKYHEAVARHRDVPYKQPQRDCIMQFLLEHHRPGPIKLCSLPGMYWRFENQLADQADREITFVGLEHHWGLIEKYCGWMPGDNPHYAEERMVNGSLPMYVTDCASWIFIKAGSFFSVQPDDFPSPNRRKSFNRKYRGFTMVWLDFMSPFCADVEAALVGLGDYCHRELPVIPFAITVMYGRDRPSRKLPEGYRLDRVGYVKELLGRRGVVRFESHASWMYTSQDGARMLNIVGLLHNQRPGSEESAELRSVVQL